MSDVDDALAATDRIGSYKQPTVGEWAAIRLAEEVRTLRARVAELEALRKEPSGVEWGFWWNGPAAEGGGIEPCGSRGIAEELAKIYPGQGTVRQRDVYAPGPWREVSS